jgi:hypothetical protein
MSIDSGDPSAEQDIYGTPPLFPRSEAVQAPVDAQSSPSQEQDDQPEEEAPARTFPERHREAFTGLLFLGYLTETFTWMGHDFTIRTLRTDESLKVNLVIKPYLGTRGEFMAWKSAQVAACIEIVDGSPLVQPLGPSDETLLQMRFDYVTKNWYHITVDAVHARLAALESEAKELVTEMGKVGG